MTAEKALLGYRERVVQEKQRIEQHMQGVSKAEQLAWSKTRTTRRHLVGNSERLLAKRVNTLTFLYSLSVLRGSFDFSGGFTATVVRTTPDTEVVTQSFEVGRLPVHIGDDVFISVDHVEPFVGGGEDGAKVRLLTYSGAGLDGSWPDGTVIGTEAEFNKEAMGKK